MDYHRLLQKQISKHLTIDCVENPAFKGFIQAVNDSYHSFIRDTDLINHAFQESEKEYHEINDRLKQEYDLKKRSIANLYESLLEIDEDYKDIKETDKNDLLFISRYLKEQIRKRKETENSLLRTVELLKTLLASLQSGILVEDENRKILFTNQLFCDMFSIPLPPESMIGVDCTNSAEQSKNSFKDAESFGPRITEILSKQEIQMNELLETADNRFLVRDYIPVFIDKKYKGHLWKYTDVTQRIQVQNQLEQSEELSRLIMNASLNAIITINTEGLVTFWNAKAETIFGWKQEEALGKSLTKLIIPKQHIEGHNKGMEHYLKTGEGPVLNKQMEMTALNKMGNEFPVDISIIPINQNGDTFFCAFIQDISKRKQAESNLIFQEEKYRNIIANMNIGLIEVDNNEIIQFANQSFSTISGFEQNELVGKNPSEIFVFGENFEIMETKKGLRKQGISDIYQIPVKNKRGELRWWAISGAPNYDDKGQLVGSIGIHLDITEQKELEIDLENEKLKAEEASKSKEAFLANMSHEIRTPLNAIIGFLRELEKQKLTETQHKYIENSTIASKHLLAIINTILDISKIEAGEMSLENEDFVFEYSIKKVISVLEPKAKQKGLLLKTSIASEINPVLKGDTLRLEQILFNLVGNALKFTHEGEIAINCELIKNTTTNQIVRISISDTGIGMDKQFVESIFKKFSQEDKAITRKFGGTGLGMAITKELVQLMKGTIELESEKNKGTTIHINLPFHKGDGAYLKNSQVKKEVVSIENLSILLVEDNEMNRMVAQNSLHYYNCKVTEAENGLEALKILKNHSFDIILMDIQMPEMDGIEATKIIRNELKLKTPIIALTANAFKTEISRCRNAGMNDHLTKPFEELHLIEMIAKHTQKQVVGTPLLKEKEPLKSRSYNLDALNSLSRGDTAFVLKMLQIFMEQSILTIEKVEKAIHDNDFLEVSRLIHKIKPSIESLEIQAIITPIKLLEKTAAENKESDKDAIVLLFDSIKIVLQKVCLELHENEFKV